MTSNRPISNSKGICFSVASILGVGKDEENGSPPTEDGVNEIAIPCDVNKELSTKMVLNAPKRTAKIAGHEFGQSSGHEMESSTASAQQWVRRGENASSADVLSDCIKQNSCSKEPSLNVEKYSVGHCFDKFKEGDISQTACSLSIALSIPECQADNNTTSACVSDDSVRLNPWSKINMSTDLPPKSDTGCSSNICGNFSVSAEGKNCESECCSLPVQTVHIKSEKVDEEYDAALTGIKNTAFSQKRSHRGLASKAANRHRSKEPEIISTVIRKEGKKKVRITVIRGEWRTPKEGRSIRKVAKQPSANKQAIDSSGVINQEPVSNCETEGSPFPSRKSLFPSHQRRTRRRPGPLLSVTLVSDTQPEASCFDAESNSASEKKEQRSGKKSAVPTALFRNYYIKTEVDDERDTQRKESSDAEEEREGSSEHRENRARDVITEGHGSSRQSSDVNIPSLLALHSGRDVRRRRGRCGVYSWAARQLQEKFDSLKVKQSEKLVMPKMRKCVVELQGLPASITTAGFINLKTDSKMLRDAVRLTTSLGLRKRPRDVHRPYECEQCGKRFIQKSHRSQHFKVHLGVKEHSCTVCGACFMYKSTLTSHQRFKHLGEKPYSCSICKKAFSYSSHLSVHMQRHYDERPLTCPICHKQYGAYYIVNHMKTHSDERLFACKLCGAQLKSKKALELHEAVHEGLRPWTCSICTATFPYKSSLILHERAHRGERPYCCDQCPATFTQSTHLRTHLKGVHKIENPPTCRGARMKVERVPAQRLDSSKEDAILLMRRAMSKVTKECRRKKILPISAALPGKASGSQSSSDLQHSDKRPRSSSNHCVKKFRKLEKTNDSMEKVDIDGSVPDDGNREGLGEAKGHDEAEVSDNLVVKIEFIKHHNLREMKI